VRHGSGDPGKDVTSLRQAFSEILLALPEAEIVRVDDLPGS
jgi:hypothetical protein